MKKEEYSLVYKAIHGDSHASVSYTHLDVYKRQQLQRLNEYQKAAVFDESSACLVNANVGSGKTTVLITKVMYLHYEKQIPYEQMVVLTFTNKAADEIKERLYALEPEITEEQLWGFGTFHSVCLTMLKKMLPVENLGYTKEFMVMDPDEELGMAEQLILTCLLYTSEFVITETAPDGQTRTL